MGFVDELRWRNMLQDLTPGVEEYLEGGIRKAYIGFDPTAPSLGIGNFVQIMILSLYQRCGHRPVVIMGGATGRIGDPSGKDKERELKSEDELQANIDAQLNQIKNLLDFEDSNTGAVIINNFDFYKDMNVLHFLRDVGKNATINYMLSKESVKRRLETGISYTEFSYQLLQAYDFYRLYKDHDCKIQMGGSDQWGNIIAGADYISKNIPGAQAYAITTPLLTKSDGKKFGKSEEGNIWLDPKMTSPYKFYQYWLNIDDSDISKLFRYFSFRTKDDIESLEEKHRDSPGQLKRIFSTEITERVHGAGATQRVSQISELMFNKDLSAQNLHAMSENVFHDVTAELPSITIHRTNLVQSANIIDFLSEKSGLFSSKSEARRAIQSNAVSINKIKITDLNHLINPSDAIHGQFFLVENGKKNKFMLTLD
ncbi:MAG TPA: tyrosine--tRNA ligase [Saprospiraceae bacterium]|nr:tyrosine--tRNA ligase [Saprospiraceae bacterium]